MDAEETRAGESIRKWFAIAHPTWTLGLVDLLVTEGTRHVFSVRYQEQGLAGMTMPGPYLVVSVDRTSLEINGIDLTKSPEYRLMVRGRK